MQGAEILESDEFVEFLHERLEPGRRHEVVACGEAVAGVDADPDSRVVLGGDLSEEVAEFAERAADCRAVAAHCFEDWCYG